MLRKVFAYVPLIALAAGVAVLPSAAAEERPAAPPVPVSCADLTGQLSALVTKLTTALLPVPDPAKLTPLLGDGLALVSKLQSTPKAAGSTETCLPALPVSAPVPVPVAEKDLPACLGEVVGLLKGFVDALAALLTGGLPDPAAIIGAVTKLVSSLKDVITKQCLPAPPGGLPIAPPGLPISPPGGLPPIAPPGGLPPIAPPGGLPPIAPPGGLPIQPPGGLPIPPPPGLPIPPPPGLPIQPPGGLPIPPPPLPVG